MSDNKQNQGKQDRIRVDANDPNEVNYLRSKYPDISADRIRQAIKEFGPFRDDIEKELGASK